MIAAKPLPRSFTYNGVKLPDPDPRMTPGEVKSLYSHQYPELATAANAGQRQERLSRWSIIITRIIRSVKPRSDRRAKRGVQAGSWREAQLLPA